MPINKPHLPRGSLRSLGILHDVAVAAVSMTLALGLAWNFQGLFIYWQLWAIIGSFTLLSAVMFPLFSLNSGAWRYASLLDVASIVKAVTAIIAVFLIGHFILFRGAFLPRSALIITWFIMIVGLGGPRLLYRLSKERGFSDTAQRLAPGKVQHVVLYGFNDNADLFLRNARRSQPNTHIVAILDPRAKNWRRRLHGVKVIGDLTSLSFLVRKNELSATPISQIIITQTNLPPQEISQVVEAASPLKIAVKRLPDISRAGGVDGEAPIEALPVSLEDLLGRNEVDLDIREVAQLLNDRCIAVTGAGGSIGSELVKQISAFQPRRLLLIDNCEYNLYAIGRHLASFHPEISIVERIADVRRKDRIEAAFAAFKPDVVFHAAALKHVPLVEDNPLEGIETNLFGTRNVADAALSCDATAFVMVSTDKAVNPANVMGATKRAAEAYCQSLDLSGSRTRFMTVRFGNVLGSAGSVIPLFQSQLQRGGPLTVTHAKITRFFMTIPEACRLILHAAGHGVASRTARGQIFVLDMGEPILITTLAERLIQLAGLRPNVDIKIEYTGLRPGEKLYEELFAEGETVEKTARPGLLTANSSVSDSSFLRRNFEAMEKALAASDTDRAIDLLKHIVPDFRQEPAAIAQPTPEQSGFSPNLPIPPAS
ncbi:polysaccharide biosynthesis protein [Aureimonas fodinaquatilis]|uniref:Polysaccharide biosynthesis protein n=1 Tax=Aureimonas fodinaquatilis TaxID=2565783 RepID=A0A5B0DTS0_9HYPH|nr:nucleoside-diphosphate sugar epimerase/dehydratase [Aureimonas fodinaquatilis]KAA0968960.1 polysaccharide biosynthesis protein [Aureimonas fodinaquatilis]